VYASQIALEGARHSLQKCLIGILMEAPSKEPVSADAMLVLTNPLEVIWLRCPGLLLNHTFWQNGKNCHHLVHVYIACLQFLCFLYHSLSPANFSLTCG
jgi:hypothetical protein